MLINLKFGTRMDLLPAALHQLLACSMDTVIPSISMHNASRLSCMAFLSAAYWNIPRYMYHLRVHGRSIAERIGARGPWKISLPPPPNNLHVLET